MYFPDVPIALGVPGVPRIPVAIIGQVSQGLNGAADIVSQVAVDITRNPLAQLSTIAPSIANATTLVNGVQSTIGAFPSSLFNQFSSPVGMIQDTLGSISSAIALDPTAPVSSVNGLVGTVDAQLEGTTTAYGAAVDVTQGAPSLDADGVETVTVTGYRNEVSWGLVKDGKPVIQGDNFISLEFKKDYVISDYPVEEGGFASYNKVNLPFDARIAVSCGGSVDKRATFLQSIKAVEGDLVLYDLVMPEDTLHSVNIQHVDFKRTAINGNGLITAYIYVLEIRETVEAAFAQANGAATPASPTNTKSPAGAATRNDGTVQIGVLTPQQSQQVQALVADIAAPGT